MRISLEPRVLWSSCLVALVVLVPNSVHGQLGPCAGKIGYTEIGGVGSPVMLAANNHRMVTSDGPTLTSWQVDDLGSPRFLGRWTLWNEADVSFHWMQIDERGFVFVGSGWPSGYPRWYSVRIWDLRGNREPQPASELQGSFVDSYIDETTFVGIPASAEGLVIIDTRNPLAPEIVCTNCGGITLGNGPPSYGHDHIRIENVAGNAVILDFDEVSVVDYTNPSSPVVLSSITLASPVVGTDTIMWANDVLAVVGPTGSGEMVVLDLHDPAFPVVSTHDFVPLRDVTWGLFHKSTLVVYGNFSNWAALRFDFSDPGNPVELPPIDLGYWAYSASVWGDSLFIGGTSRVEIYDLDGTPTPVGIGPRDRYADRIAVGAGVGLATGGPHLFTYDVGGPARPTEVASFELDWSPRNPATDGAMGAVMRYGEGVVPLDLRDPADPVFLESLPVQGTYVTDIEIGDGVLAVASRDLDGAGWLELWNVVFGSSADVLARIERNDPIWQIEMFGDRIFLGLEGAVVEVDVSEPDHPVSGTPLDLQNLEFAITGLETMGHELFAVDGYRIAVVDISEPGSMVERYVSNSGLGAPHGHGGASWLASDGENLVAGENGGYFNVVGSPDSAGTLPLVHLKAPPVSSLSSGVWDAKLFVASRFNLITLDLSCAPVEADFVWYTMGTKLQLIDQTTFDDFGTDRAWTWTIGGDPRVFTTRSPLIEVESLGTYEVTVEVTTGSETVFTTKNVDVTHPSGLFPVNRQSGRRVGP